MKKEPGKRGYFAEAGDLPTLAAEVQRALGERTQAAA